MNQVNKVLVFSKYVKLVSDRIIPHLLIVLVFQSEIHDM